jgi:sarcosine oxidase subunit gamma
VASLTARTAFAGLLPITEAALTLSEAAPEAITWVAPYRGQVAAVSAELDRRTGCAFPAPNRFTAKGGRRIVWTGPEQAFVLGAAPGDIAGAAIGDQSGGWAACALEGDGAAEVLARLLPIDLRDDRFAVGHAARSLLGHMSCVLMRTGPARYEVLVFRSMAASAAHELHRAMRMVAARRAL